MFEGEIVAGRRFAQHRPFRTVVGAVTIRHLLVGGTEDVGLFVLVVGRRE